jgi:hypothetical protein
MTVIRGREVEVPQGEIMHCLKYNNAGIYYGFDAAYFPQFQIKSCGILH